MKHDETFGNRVRELRKKYNLTQLELCKLIITKEYPEGLPKSTLAGYENGLRRPKFEVVEKLSEVLNTSSDFLIGITDDPITSKPNKDLIKLLKSNDYHIDGKKLTNEDMEFAIKFLEKLAKSEGYQNDKKTEEFSEELIKPNLELETNGEK